MDMAKVIKGLEHCDFGDFDCYEEECPYYQTHACTDELKYDILDLLKEREPRILSLGEALEGKNGLEIDPCVFVEIKGREDIFIGTVNDVSHYNYPNSVFDVGECFRIDRSYSAASKNYLNTDYMKTVRCWTHKPSKEQRKAVKWND